MGDIVIRGIEMPKDKPLNLSIYPNGEVVLFCIQGRDVYDNECNYGDYKHKKIAVELPEPHGDLIDRSKLSTTAITDYNLEGHLVVEIEDIENAPTILEATE